MKKQRPKEDRPEYGKVYALTGAKGTPCIANGDTWKESEVKEIPKATQTRDLTK